MKIQFSGTLRAIPNKPMYMVGRVWPEPSEKKRSRKTSVIAGAPQAMACIYSTAVGMMTGSMPMTCSRGSPLAMSAANTTARASAIHQACLKASPARACRPAPSSCATVGCNAISVPSTNMSMEDQTAPPMASAASATSF